MQSKQANKEEPTIQQLNKEQSLLQPLHCSQSKYSQDYKKFLDISEGICQPQSLSHQASSQQINKGQEQPCQKQRQIVRFECHIELELNNFQAILFSVSASRFKGEISLLNIKGKNPLLNQRNFKSGSFGQTYCIMFANEARAIKTFQFKNKDEMPVTINKAIKEYTILKICSSLGCGPYTKNPFGFDLIAYDDSIIFCMEMCQEITLMDSSIIFDLKKSLKIMHQHHIIHFDIKPDNIMFSPHFKKPVFIDFGFSEIIKQQIGSESLVTFRGSPAFCSKQMNLLFGKAQCYDYIDVYFNDAYCLNKSISCMHQEHLFFDDFLTNNDTMFIKSEDIQHGFLIILLKYKLLQINQEEIVKLLSYKENLLLKKYGKEVFNAFQNSFELFQQIYKKLNKQINHFIDSVIIHLFFKSRYRMLGSSNNQNDFRIRFSSNCKNEIFHIPEQKYRQFLQIEDIFFNPEYKEQSRHILIEYLRFDCKNNNLNQKIIVASRFNQSEDLSSQLNLDAIRTTFTILFKECLDPPRTNWKKQHIFIVLIQLIMLDVNLEPYIQKLFGTINQLFDSFYDKITCSMECLNIIFLNYFKHLSDHQFMKANFHSDFQGFAKQTIQKAISQHKNSQDSEIRLVVSVLEEFLVPHQLQFIIGSYYKMMRKLSHLSSNTFKKRLLQFICLLVLELSQLQTNCQSAFQHLKNIKQFIYKEFFKPQKGLHYSLFHIAKISNIIKNWKEQTVFYQSLVNQINCVEISRKFKFQMCIFLFSQSMQVQKIHKYALQILQSPKLGFDIKINSQFGLIIEKIKQNTHFLQIYPEMLAKFSDIFTQIQNRSDQEQYLNGATIQLLMYHYNIIDLFFAASKILRQEWIEKYTKQIQARKVCHEEECIQKRKYKQFKENIYLCIYYQRQQMHRQTLVTCERLYSIAKEVKHEKAINYFIKKIILAAMTLKDRDKLRQFVYQFYEISDTIASYQRYFQSKCKTYIQVTLYQFQSGKDLQKYYSFLISLAKFITLFPEPGNIHHWYQSLKVVMTSPNHLQLMRYDLLHQYFHQSYWKNRYFNFYFIYCLQSQKKYNKRKQIFIKLSKNIGFLNITAKNIVMIECLHFILYELTTNDQKRNYLIRKWGYKYMQKGYLKRLLRQKLTRFFDICRDQRKVKVMKRKINAAVKSQQC